MQAQLGATEFFDGTATVEGRKVKVLKILEAATFSSLVMQFPATPAHDDAADPADITFPATTEIRDVESFVLASGSVQAIYAV